MNKKIGKNRKSSINVYSKFVKPLIFFTIFNDFKILYISNRSIIINTH